MIIPFGQDPVHMQLAMAVSELESCNREIERHGLSLTTQDIQTLVAGRLESLEVSERVEFGGGVVKHIVLAFAGSPFVSRENLVPTVLELQELFYDFKNESLEQIPDEDLIAKMRSLFDDPAQGDLTFLAEALFEGLGRHMREEAVGDPGAADATADNAVMNAYTLAAHRYNVSDWVDETYAPGWEGSSWLDE
ncbi:MAG: hypothetical protein CVT67_10115 [Actinobacteria bacterium HGW-Actinobacteria-7]|nr:MAG: hypothetical protein CVT67_10115 [Actinobacteria bacterium HGW-Actinobacteria-7]